MKNKLTPVDTKLKTFKKNLRAKAQMQCVKEPHLTIRHLKRMSLEEIESTIHELHVHQIELEMQNEELYKTQLELYNTKMRYFELYDMAPIGYCTLSQEGTIVEANLCSSNLLGTERSHLKNKMFSNFIFKEDQDIFYLFNKKINMSNKQESCELRMLNSEGRIFWVNITANLKKNTQGELCHLLVFHDISEHKSIEVMKSYNNKLRNLSKHILRAREDERKTIAREIHDELGQLMTALKIDLSWLRQKIPKESELLLPKIDTMMTTLDLAIRTIRDIVAKLRPLILDDLGLEAAMEWHAQKYLTPANIKYTLVFKLNEDLLSEDLNIVLFRIYQEALTNAIRYAKANTIFISLTHKGETLLLEIKDNGIGITDSQINNPKSFGLIGIKERLRPYTGTLDIISKEGLGTTLKATIHHFKKELFHD